MGGNVCFGCSVKIAAVTGCQRGDVCRDTDRLLTSATVIPPASLAYCLSRGSLGVIFDSTLSMSDLISAITKSCFCHIRDPRGSRNTLDHTAAKTIATSLTHS